jgi:hypothetical protein
MDMGRTARVWVCVAILGLAGLDTMNAALASPPGSHRGSSPHPALDLRPSANALAPAENARQNFPSSLHRHNLGAQEEIPLPVIGAGTAQGRIPSRAEEFARRVHREGLPVARLWENKSALLSLGLNKKGKPGLWIIQKIR